MRKVKVAAIQPGYIEICDTNECGSVENRNEPSEIIKNYVRSHLEITTRLMEKAGEECCDIVTSSEDITGLSPYLAEIAPQNIFSELVELSAPIVEKKLCSIAKKYNMYIIGSYFKKIGNSHYNVATIFDRNGSILDEYRKTHLPSIEKWQCTEGTQIDVFELDFGKIGISICYDMMFQEHMRILALKGAEIVFHPTLGYGWYDSIGEATLRTRANDNSVYIVTAKNYVFNSAGKSSIIDFWGQILADAGFYENSIVYKEIDLDLKKTQPDWSYHVQVSGIKDVKVRNLMERRPELYSAISMKINERLQELDYNEKINVLKNIKDGKCHW